MVKVRFERVLALPSSAVANTIYFVKPSSASFLSLYITGNDAVPVPSGSDGGGSGGPVYWSAVLGKPTTVAGYGITDAQSAAGTIAWSRVTGAPTTLSGYGIADAQPLDGDLTSLAAASATNAIYYRSATNTWAPVTLGANLTFSSGTLSATLSGGGGGDMYKADNLSGLANNTTALTNLGGTTVGRALFVAADAATARTAIGAGTGNGTVTSVTGTAPVVSSGGATPAISITAATQGAAGSMSAADKTKLDAITGTNTGDQTTITGNAGTATTLQTARLINGVSFNGSANITVPAVDTATPRLAVASNLSDLASVATARTNLGVPSGSGTSTGTNTGDQTSVTGNAGTATALQTPRTINGVAFDGTSNITVADATKVPLAQVVNTYSGTAQTAALADNGALVRMTNAAANTFTLPTNATVAFPVGTRIDVQQVGVGKTTIAAASGVTIEVTNKSVGAQYAAVSAVKVATDTWTLIGNLIA